MAEVLIQEAIEKTKDESIKYSPKSSGLWYAIAKNEIKLRTSRYRKHRKLFFIIIYSILLSWAFLIAPLLFDLFMPSIAAQFPDSFEPIIALIIEFSLMTVFLFMVMYPLSNMFRNNEQGFKETLLASPVKSGDIFLGEYLGKFPIYSMMVLLIAPIMVGLINPLINLTILHYAVIYTSVFVMAYFANLIGCIITSWLEHKILKSERTRDWGKALIIIFTILLVIIMYSAIFFFNEILTNPEIKNFMSFYPSIWYSNIILYSINPMLINSYFLNIWVSIILSSAIPILTLYISYRNADSFYSLERISEQSKAKREHRVNFYTIISSIFGHKWRGLVRIQLKRFLRKKANIARFAYVIGLAGFITWFLGSLEQDPFLIVLTSTVLIALGGGMCSMMIGHLAFIGSKDLIWVYKRSPRGTKGLIYSYLLTMLLMNIILATIITILYSIFANLDLAFSLVFFVEFLVFAEISMCQAMGLQCISPAFGEKEAKMKSNAMISMLLMQPLLFMPIILIIFIGLNDVGSLLLLSHGSLFLYNIATSLPLLLYGMKKLNKYE